MCPACLTTIALIAAGTTSTGGLSMLVVKKIRAKSGAKNINPNTVSKGNQDGSAKSRNTN
jgi:hypothetical protein